MQDLESRSFRHNKIDADLGVHVTSAAKVATVICAHEECINSKCKLVNYAFVLNYAIFSLSVSVS